MLMSNLVVGIFLGVLGLGIVGGLLLAAFFLGARQNKISSKKAGPPSAPTLQKRRVPTSGSTIPTGGIAQTQFRVSGFQNDSSDTD
jgi:hypothetical protein